MEQEHEGKINQNKKETQHLKHQQKSHSMNDAKSNIINKANTNCSCAHFLGVYAECSPGVAAPPSLNAHSSLTGRLNSEPLKCQRVSGSTVPTLDLLLMPVEPAQRIEIHQTLILRQLPPRVHTNGQAGWAEGMGADGWLKTTP